MNNLQALCLFRGFSGEETDTAAAASEALLKLRGFASAALYTAAVDDNLLSVNVGSHIDALIRSEFSASAPYPAPAAETDRLDGIRAVLILTDERELLFTIMRAVKTVLPEPQDIIFASVTETALTWTFHEYLTHLAQEHAYMKDHPPETGGEG
jgi:hypothetical protein